MMPLVTVGGLKSEVNLHTVDLLSTVTHEFVHILGYEHNIMNVSGSFFACVIFSMRYSQLQNYFVNGLMVLFSLNGRWTDIIDSYKNLPAIP
jgi:hypothetical protein